MEDTAPAGSAASAGGTGTPYVGVTREVAALSFRPQIFIIGIAALCRIALTLRNPLRAEPVNTDNVRANSEMRNIPGDARYCFDF